MGTQDDRFYCPQSRHAGLPDAAMESAQRQGRLRLLSHGEQVGYTIFETPDQRQLMHLGHPEYNVGRILGEMERDRARGDVPPPENFDADHPQTLWRSHRNLLFQQWLWFCYQRQPDRLRLNRYHKSLGPFRSRFAVQFPLERGDAALPQTMPAAPKSLKVLLRRDADQLNGVAPAADLDRTLEAAPAHVAVVELIAEALLSPLQELNFGDACRHGKTVWAGWGRPTGTVIRVHGSSNREERELTRQS